MNALLRISKAIDAVIEAIGKILPFLVIVMIAAGLYNVVARYKRRRESA